MSAPRVSVCIPAYARPQELREGIDSVLRQSFDDVEVVVGDDSGDLEAAVASIGDPRVRYHRNPVRLGMAGNWNAVLDRARGEYLALLMDDDRLLPGFLEKTVAALDADPQIGIAFTNHVFASERGATTRDCKLAPGRYDDFLAHFVEHMPVAVSAALMRREVWERVRPLPDMKTADVVLHVRAALAGFPFQYIDEPLMAYRIHPGQLSSDEVFRKDVVAAWEQFQFDDPRAERLRHLRLAEALASRAGAHLRNSRPDAARADIRRALALDPRSRWMRRRAIAYLSRHPSVTPAALGALARAGLISRGS